jgi:TPR repeat protein
MRFFVLVVVVLASQAARADLLTAQAAYKKGDYEAAAKEYRALAEGGNPIAQFDLAALYVNGQGVRRSDINAYAWASLAAASGNVQAKALAEKLRPSLSPGAEQVARDIVAPYDHAAQDAAIMPHMEDDPERAARCKMLSRTINIDYPPEAVRRGMQSQIFVEYAVAADGRARNPRIIYALPKGTFEAAARNLVMSIEHPAGETVEHCRLMVRFDMSNEFYPRLQAYAADMRKDAEAGDPESQYIYGLMLAGLPQLGKSHKDALPWFLKAAQGGSPAAQYQVGSSLLYGIGCQCEVTKGSVWLKRAAEAGDPEAQVTLGAYALRGDPTVQDMAIAQLWLERAVASNDLDGTYYLASLLAAAPDEHVRDPKRALHLLDTLKHEQDGNPSVLEIRAAAQAASGAYSDAVASEGKAIVQAKRLKWDIVPLNERLARYQAGQPWFGNLLIL